MDIRTIKIFGVFVLCTIVSSLFWYFSSLWIKSPTLFGDYGLWLRPVVGLCVLSTLMGLGFLVFNENKLSFGLSALVSSILLLSFGFSQLSLLAVMVLIIFHVYAARALNQDVEERIKLNIELIMHRGLWYIITPFLIAISFMYYQTPQNQASARRHELPESIKQTIQTVSNYWLDLQHIAPADKSLIEKELVSQTTITLTAMAQPYLKYAPPILAFGLFIGLQSLSFVFVVLSTYLAMLGFFLMKRLEFVAVDERSIKAERLKF